MSDILSVIRRYSRGLLVWIGACILVALTYLSTAQPEFSASTLIVLEPKRSFLNASLTNGAIAQANLDNSQIETQMQIIKSEKVLRFAFKSLDLKDAVEFNTPPSAFRLWLDSVMGKTQAVDFGDRRELSAYVAFADKASVRRVGQSLVIEVGYRAASAIDAARIANSITAAYIRDQVETTSIAIRNGSDWLQGRINEIKTQLDASAEAVRKGAFSDTQFSASDARLISTASVPLAKSYPQTTLLLIFTASFAFFTGLCGVMVAHSLDRKFRSRRDVIKHASLDCVAVAPFVKRMRKDSSFAAFLRYAVADATKFKPFSQSIRQVRASIISASTNKKPLIVGIISYSAREGKSVIAANLAYALAASSQETVLIDANLHQGSLTANLTPGEHSNLRDYLTGTSSAAFSMEPLANSLYFIPAASESVSEDPDVFVGSAAMKALFDGLQNYEFVIVDLPAFSASSDVRAISPLLDAAVLVIETGRTTTDEIAELQDSLRQSNLHVIGAILNKRSS